MKKSLVSPQLYPFSLNYACKTAFLGSCFSEHLSSRMQEYGFNVLANPLGVVFNPLSIADFIERALTDQSLSNSIVQREDVYLSWLANSKIHAYSEADLSEILAQKSTDFKKYISSADALFITFGSAWTYTHLGSDQLVANCHKFPASSFTKKCLTVEEVTVKWQRVMGLLWKFNPKLTIILTVSPVRHVKDGLVENQQSKSVLKLACSYLTSGISSVSYFPAYEIVLDELRDYAFFEADGVHPNKFAIDEITKRFTTSFLDVKSQEILQEFIQLKRSLEHKPLHADAESTVQFRKQVEERIAEFIQCYPYLETALTIKSAQ